MVMDLNYQDEKENKKKFDLSTIKPIIESDLYAIYVLGYVTETVRKGIRYNKKTKEQVEVKVQMLPTPHVIDIISSEIQNKR